MEGASSFFIFALNSRSEMASTISGVISTSPMRDCPWPELSPLPAGLPRRERRGPVSLSGLVFSDFLEESPSGLDSGEDSPGL